MSDAGRRDQTGRQLGPYLLEAPLGEGASGRTYRARHVELDVLRTVEVVPAGDARFRDGFLREARAAARLHHPNLVAVTDFGTEGDLLYLVMEYVDAATMEERLRRIPLAERLRHEAVRRWILDAAAGLDHAHAAGVVHRDLRPANVLIDAVADRAMLTEFGIAEAGADRGLAAAGRPATYAYLSPEQCAGATALTGACDVYALAAVLYEIASGDPPFGRGISAVTGHVAQPVPPLAVRRPDLPAGLDAVLARGLAKAPARRYPTAGELAGETLRAASEPAGAPAPVTAGWSPPLVPVVVAPAAPAEVVARRFAGLRSRHAWVALALLLAGAGVAAGVAAGAGRAPVPAAAPAPGPGLPAPVTGSLGSPVAVDGLRLTVLSVDPDAPPPAALELAPGDRFVTVLVQCRDTDERPAPVSPYDWTLSDAAGGEYGAVVDGLPAPLREQMLAPGQSVRGQVGFVVPRPAQGLALNFDAELGDGSARVPLDGD